MRGKPAVLNHTDRRVRITPAYAGKTSNNGGQRAAFRDHPRVCGENAITASVCQPGIGSPPRMRGKLCEGALELGETRITPAYAGKTIPHGGV